MRNTMAEFHLGNDNDFGGIVCGFCGKNDDLVLNKCYGRVTCHKCGFIAVDQILDDSDETKIFNEDSRGNVNKTKRSGTAFSDSQVQIMIRTKRRNLLVVQGQINNSDPLMLICHRVKRVIYDICSNLDIAKSLQEVASQLVQTLVMERLYGHLKSHLETQETKEIFAMACISIACRLKGYPRTITELHIATGLNEKELHKMQRLVIDKAGVVLGRISATALVRRVASTMSLPHTLLGYCESICKSLEKYGIFVDNEVKPMTIAAFVVILVVLVSGKRVEIDLLLYKFGVSLDKIKSMYVIFIESVNKDCSITPKLLPKDLCSKCGGVNSLIKSLPLSIDFNPQSSSPLYLENTNSKYVDHLFYNENGDQRRKRLRGDSRSELERLDFNKRVAL